MAKKAVKTADETTEKTTAAKKKTTVKTVKEKPAKEVKTTAAKKTTAKKSVAKKTTAKKSVAKTAEKINNEKKASVKSSATACKPAKRKENTATQKNVTKSVAKKVVAPEQEVIQNDTRQQSAVWGNKLLERMAKYPKSVAFLLGVLLTAALPPFYYTLTLFAAFSGAMFLAYKNQKLCTLAAIGYWFGFGYFAAGFYWIGNALLVDVFKTGWLYPPVLFLNGAFFGIFTILPFMATRCGKNIVAKSMLFAAVWCLIVEWLRGFILTGFPWNPVSSVLTFNPELMQILAYVGTYGASLILVWLAVLPAAWLIKLNRKRFYGVGCFVALCWAMLWIGGGYIVENRPQISAGDSLVVRLVQPSIPQTLKWNRALLEQNLQTYVDLSNSHNNSHVDFTIWGETAYPFDLTADYNHNRKITSAVPPYGYLITGFLRRVDDGIHYTPYNSFGVINRSGHLVGWYDKTHLVPFGEYIPFRKFLPESIKPIAGIVAEFGRGEKFKTLAFDNIPPFAPLICYEIIFSDEVVRKGKEKPAWAVVLTNDGWYGNSAGPYQHLAAAQMRAVEEGISVVRSANSGISAVVNPYGEIKAEIPLGAVETVDALVKPKEARQTWFGLYGNKIPLAMSGVLILLSFIISLFSRRKS